jgi:hypothetical protein
MLNLDNSPTNLELSAEAIASFVECCGGKVMSFEGHERRTHMRYVVALQSVVQPLDDEHRPLGNSFHGVTRDISVGGMALVHTQPVTAKFLNVTLSSPEGNHMQTILKVLRCSPLGTYYDIAGEFVIRRRER